MKNPNSQRNVAGPCSKYSLIPLLLFGLVVQFFALFLPFSFSLIKAADKEFREKAIYGEDDRTDVRTLADLAWQEKIMSTAAMIERDEFIYNGRKGTYTLKSEKTLESIGVCPTERFAQQPMAARCTGFLIAPDKILTAGHCVPDANSCKKHRWVFDYKMEGEKEFKKVYGKSLVYQCLKISKRAYNPATSVDYAVIQLYRKVQGRKPLEMEKEKPVTGTPLAIIGHPSGLPSKIAIGDTKVGEVLPFSFKSNLDSFAGNSGSPVFNAQSGKVLGILVSGSPDYVFDAEAKCQKVNICTEENCFWETASLVSNAL